MRVHYVRVYVVLVHYVRVMVCGGTLYQSVCCVVTLC